MQAEDRSQLHQGEAILAMHMLNKQTAQMQHDTRPHRLKRTQAHAAVEQHSNHRRTAIEEGMHDITHSMTTHRQLVQSRSTDHHLAIDAMQSKC